MNWYKKAFPLSDQSLSRYSPVGYMGVGHHKLPGLTRGRLPNFDKIVNEGIWAMDKNFKIHFVPVHWTNKNDDHNILNLQDPERFVAKGRYEEEEDGTSRVSLVYLSSQNESVFSIRKRKNKIIEELDRFFDNPTILEL